MADSSVSRRFPMFHLKIGRSLAQFTTKGDSAEKVRMARTILYRRIPRIEGLYVIQEKPTQVMLALTQLA